jgi:hypothetical protein
MNAKFSNVIVIAFALALAASMCEAKDGSTSAAKQGAVDLAGNLVDPLHNVTNRALVLIFIGRECPISNGYAPELKRLKEKFAPEGVKFLLIYPNSDDTPDLIRRHIREYQLDCEALRDPAHTLVKRAQATVTPEVAVFAANRFVYRGRIDDRHVALGKQRPEARQHDLEEALASILAGKKPAASFRKPVGCYIPEP